VWVKMTHETYKKLRRGPSSAARESVEGGSRSQEQKWEGERQGTSEMHRKITDNGIHGKINAWKGKMEKTMKWKRHPAITSRLRGSKSCKCACTESEKSASEKNWA